MISKDDPLENLYVDKDEVDRLRLFLSLKNYLGIDKETGEPVFFEPYYNQNKKEKLIIYLLYRRAASALGHIDKSQIGIGARDLAKRLNIDYEEVRELLSNIPPVDNDKKRGRYYIPKDKIKESLHEIGHEDDVYYSTEEHTKRIS